eukprot:TRINITY_DN2783_c0_g3_i1.p1 TRINITY_DN2783_c0_g3~~TRINITY_DN2783_c0_g3_i1.p1  ORF type:complete len:218 (-),score=31.52 TRINITY_DN2783_c0_g3_i1:107-760(-)
MQTTKAFSIDSLLSNSEPETKQFSNPLECLAHATLTSDESEWPAGNEQVTVVPGPSGPQVRLSNGVGPLAHIDIGLLQAMKCRNRECNNLCGQADKPRSIYCSKRCQSREQNLRQGRIKNVKRKTTKAPPPFTKSKTISKVKDTVVVSTSPSLTKAVPLNQSPNSSFSSLLLNSSKSTPDSPTRSTTTTTPPPSSGTSSFLPSHPDLLLHSQRRLVI